MSKRLAFGVTALAALLGAPRPAAQTPPLEDVLKRSAGYVAEFRTQLSGIVAEETYRQEISNTARVYNNAFQVNQPRTRTLKSDLLLVKPADSERYVELRDVFEVDGSPIRQRQSRLENALRDPSAQANKTIQSIINESARYNIGTITRNVNTPLMALQFLEAEYQPRFKFKHVQEDKPVFKHSNTDANETPVFRVATEMWTVEYQERQRNTVIRNLEGRDLPAHGRFWINPVNGSVLISELIVDGGGVIATVTVSYQSEPLMGFLVPIEMRESYIRYGELITGRAQYGKFRPIQK